MEALIWGLIGEGVLMLCGLLITLAFGITMLIATLGGHRPERGSAIRRMISALRPLMNDE